VVDERGGLERCCSAVWATPIEIKGGHGPLPFGTYEDGAPVAAGIGLKTFV